MADDKNEKAFEVSAMKLAEASKNALPYIGNIRAMKQLYKALNDYMKIAKKLKKC